MNKPQFQNPSARRMILYALAVLAIANYQAKAQSARSGPLSVAGSIAHATAVRDCIPPPVGLVSWWSGERNTYDRMDRNNGTALNGVGYDTGRVLVGYAFLFNGERAGIHIADSASLRLTHSLTIEAWLYVLSADRFGMVLFRGDDRPGRDPYYLSIDADGTLRFHVEAMEDQANIHVPVPLKRWMHVAATLDDESGAMKLYIDGEVVAETRTTVRPLGDLDQTQGPHVGIGNYGSATTDYSLPFHGLIDEIAIYNRALTAGEIQTLFAFSDKGKCLPEAAEPQ